MSGKSKTRADAFARAVRELMKEPRFDGLHFCGVVADVLEHDNERVQTAINSMVSGSPGLLRNCLDELTQCLENAGKQAQLKGEN